MTHRQQQQQKDWISFKFLKFVHQKTVSTEFKENSQNGRKHYGINTQNIYQKLLKLNNNKTKLSS